LDLTPANAGRIPMIMHLYIYIHPILLQTSLCNCSWC